MVIMSLKLKILLYINTQMVQNNIQNVATFTKAIKIFNF